MPLKLVLWNMEWLNDLFVAGEGTAQFRPDGEPPQHAKDTTVRERRDHLSGVLGELDPDIVVVVEGPSRREELQLLFDTDVEGTWQVALQPPGQQTIAMAVRTDTGKFAAQPFQQFDTRSDNRFDPFLVDTDSDDIKEQHQFERRPLHVEVRTSTDQPLQILGLHLKSKGIFDALEWSRWWDKSDANRKKILAQASQVRLRFLDPYLTKAETNQIPLIVCGDINDGPGMDASEKRLFGSGVERLMGTVWHPSLCLGNAIFNTLSPQDRAELDFEKVHTTSFRDPIFNDTYQREWIDHILYSQNAAAGWVSNAKIHAIMPSGEPIWKKYKHASDHYPVSVEVSV